MTPIMKQLLAFVFGNITGCMIGVGTLVVLALIIGPT